MLRGTATSCETNALRSHWSEWKAVGVFIWKLSDFRYTTISLLYIVVYPLNMHVHKI